LALTQVICGGFHRDDHCGGLPGVSMAQLILTRAAKTGSSDDDYDVLENGVVVGRIMKAADAPEGTPWRWTLLFEYHDDRAQTLGYEKTREAAMTAFRKSWRRE
jgi:hypothetical protein